LTGREDTFSVDKVIVCGATYDPELASIVTIGNFGGSADDRYSPDWWAPDLLRSGSSSL
jgi:hypothetical protein